MHPYCGDQEAGGERGHPFGRNSHQGIGTIQRQTNTITADNGKEFAKHKEIADGLDVNVYFARPYHSWERGANENINGLIRRYIPKGTDFNELSDEFIAEVEWKLNNRPRKSLGYLTPLEYCRKMFNFDFSQCCTGS